MGPLNDAERDALADAVAALPTGAPARRAWAEGTYGWCITCGDAIGAEALTRRPDRAHCDACVAERHAAAQGKRLGVCGIKS